MQAVEIPIYSVDEYLSFEHSSDARHEFVNGELFAMVGTSRAHSLLATRLSAKIVNHLENTPCRVSQSDMKVRIDAANCFYYPDIMVCSEPVSDEPSDYYETRPRVLIEILSPSTAKRDDSEKRLNYQTLSSLQEYVLLAQDRPNATVYRRQNAQRWTRTVLDESDTLVLASLDFSVALKTLYPATDVD